VRARPLNLFDATMIVMGGIIGVGIFYTPHRVAAAVPDTSMFLMLWLVGGLAALAGALTFAELGGTFPREGGWYVFLREAFGPFASFLFAWVVLGVVSTGAIAVMVQIGVANLADLVPAIGAPDSPRSKVAGGLVIAAITALAMGGVKLGALFSNACMVIKLAAIAAMVVGALFVAGASPSAVAVPASAITLESAFVRGMLPVLFACGGWQMLCYIAPKVRDPQRLLPRAILIGVAGVVVTYLAINLSYLRVLGLDGLARDPDFAGVMARETLGPTGGKILRAAIGISALGVCAVTIIASPWMYVAMAREGLFFERFGRLHPRTETPTLALLLQGVIAIGYWIWGRAGVLIDATVYVEWIFHALVAIALLRMRATRPELPRPFTSPLYPLAPIVYLLIAIAVVSGSLIEGNVSAYTTGLRVLAIGAAIYFPWRWLMRARVARAAR
jgi:APA family basic amino acid/polyamine antiporter